tara:strand:- start:482 stop:1399 length:918 start_codon:yes stop_codon:yes gene_type:complete
MELNYFNKVRILDGGMGQELLSNGLISKGTLWSSTALLEEKYHELVVDTHLSFIQSGADVIVTNNFSSRRQRLIQNNIENKFDYINKKAGELAIKARDKSKKSILIAGGLPGQNDTYVADEREISLIKKNFYDQANIIKPYVDFFYLDVVSSGKEVEAALEATEKINLPVLVGLHVKKNGMLPSGESISEVVQKYKNNNWLGLITACVSLEIINKTLSEIKNLNIPFGFKANLWGVDEPLPVHKFNRAKFNEIGKNPNITLGTRDDVTGQIFCDFAKKIKDHGATIIGGCCETKPHHIKEIAKLK